MKQLRSILAGVVALALVIGVAVFLFVRHEHSALANRAVTSCVGKADARPGAPATLPFGLPLPGDGAKVLSVDTQGKTTVAMVSTPGNRGDLVQVRDQILQQLAGLGYRRTGTDQEPSYEAEGQFAGRYTGSIRVRPLCAGLLEVRYKIEQ